MTWPWLWSSWILNCLQGGEKKGFVVGGLRFLDASCVGVFVSGFWLIVLEVKVLGGGFLCEGFCVGGLRLVLGEGF